MLSGLNARPPGTGSSRRAPAMQGRGNWPRLPPVGRVSHFHRVESMLKHIILAASLTCGTAAYAQPQQATSPPPPGAATSPLPAPTATADARQPIGRQRDGAQKRTIRPPTSVYMGPEGRADGTTSGDGGVQSR